MKFNAAAAVAALAFAPSTLAWYNELPSCLSTFQPFVYSGCYDNGLPGQPYALDLRTDLQDATQESCAAHCKGNNYRLSGLSYYGVCYCGQTVSNALLPETSCNLPCQGNQTQTCGGDNAVSVWMDPTFEKLEEQNLQDFVPVGCWTDESSEGKALFYRQDQLDTTAMTNSMCLTACLKKGFPFAGTEYAGECYCGVVIGNGTALADDQSSCNMACNGDSQSTCGGPARLSLWVAKDLQSLQPCGFVPPVVSSLVSAVTSVVPTISVSLSLPVTVSVPTLLPVSTTSSTTTPAGNTYTAAPPPSSPTSSTPTTRSTTTSSAAVCTTTIVTPPACEYKCGKWCSNPLPSFGNTQDCLTAWSQCKVQIASCFFSAGWPDVLNCWNYADWCGKIQSYCSAGAKGGKAGCLKALPPVGGNVATTVTTTVPCASTAAPVPSSSSTSVVPIPTPTGICKQPSSRLWNYGPGNPVGGIELPLVTCNNLQADWKSGNVFKLYTQKDSKDCQSYKRPACQSACQDACQAQFNQCNNVYAQGCRVNGQVNGQYWGGGYGSKHRRDGAMSKRTFFRFSQSYSMAQLACKAQYYDCIYENQGVSANNMCTTYNGNWVGA